MRATVIPYNLSDPRVKTKPDKSKNIIKFGEKNDFPNTLIDSVDLSPTGTACLTTYIDFLKGDGLDNADLGKAKCNSAGETFNSLNEKICQNMGMFFGQYLLLKYSANGRVTEIFSLSYESCRLGERDKENKITSVFYNPYYGTQAYNENIDKDQRYHIFNPSAVLEQIQQEGPLFKGQVLFLREYQPGKPDYPIPDYYAGIDWFHADAGIAGFHKSNIKNNFLMSILLKVIGDPNAIGNSENGKKNKDLLKEDLETNFSGPDNAGKAIIFWAKNKEAFPSLESFPTSQNDKLFVAVEGIITDHIARVTKVPPIIANIQVAGKLGGSQEVLNSIDLLKHRVAGKQRLIEDMFNDLIFPIAEKNLLPKQASGEPVVYGISSFTASSIVPDILLDELTDTEKRALIGYAPLEGEDEGKKKLLIEKIGIGGTQSLLTILENFAAGKMSRDQAVGALKILFSLKNGQINSLLGPENAPLPTPVV